ncbi:hypothetical protein COCOBI_10-0600 [Coccomyxa sp. Obi]|nr:hypothetical protein COCOBI_10-0600 [Coccomyxa sp. Obi]
MEEISQDEFDCLVAEINAQKSKPSLIKSIKLLRLKGLSVHLPTTAESLKLDDAKSLAVGALLRGVVVSSPQSDASTGSIQIAELIKSVKQLHSKVDELTILQSTVKEMDKSISFLADKYDEQLKLNEEFKRSIKDLQAQLDQTKALPPAFTADQDALVVSGVAETGTPAEVQQSIQDIISETLEMPDVTVLSVERLGSQPAADGAKPRKILVKLQSRQHAMAILKAARKLKDFNTERKADGALPIGIDRNLSGGELKHRSSVWPAFKAAKAEGKMCRWQMGFRLFVDGAEVLPSGSM